MKEAGHKKNILYNSTYIRSSKNAPHKSKYRVVYLVGKIIKRSKEVTTNSGGTQDSDWEGILRGLL